MALTVGGEAQRRGVTLVHHANISSTNDPALADLATIRHPVWHVADVQTAGRGRRGNRAWSSPVGNLYASVALPDVADLRHIAELCFVAALALDDALIRLDESIFEHLRFKWPNDALFKGAKIGGILIEASSSQGLNHAVIGIGVNLVSHPPDTPYRATNFAEAGHAITRDALFAALSDSMVRALDLWNRGQGFDAIRAGWLSRAAGLGQPLTAKVGNETLFGLFAGLDQSGHLLLETDDGIKRLVAGEVSLGQSGT